MSNAGGKDVKPDSDETGTLRDGAAEANELVVSQDSTKLPASLRDLYTKKTLPAPNMKLKAVKETEAYGSMRKTARIGLALGCAFCLGLFFFGGRAVIAGAVVASGTLANETGTKSVQHPLGGVVSAIMVTEGERVVRGQVVAQFDARSMQAELRAIETTLLNQMARLARLIAERDGSKTLADVGVPELELLSASEQASIFANETIQLKLREQAREGQRQVLRERIVQMDANVFSNDASILAIDQEIKSLDDELKNLRPLLKRGLIPARRVLDSERERTRLIARRAEKVSSNATARGKAAEFELGITDINQSMRSSLTDSISETRRAVATLMKEQITATRQLEDLKVRAPQNGIVHQLAVRTAGEVVGAGAILMKIVPDDEDLIGEIRISTSDIDQLYPGQPAEIVFSAFDRGTTPQLSGQILSVSPDLERDPTTGETYYMAKLTVPQNELDRLGKIELVPGMPVEAFIKTNDRTLLSFLMKPLRDQMRRALR